MAFLELNFYSFIELYCLFPPTYACSPTHTTHRDKLVTILLQPKAFMASLRKWHILSIWPDSLSKQQLCLTFCISSSETKVTEFSIKQQSTASFYRSLLSIS